MMSKTTRIVIGCMFCFVSGGAMLHMISYFHPLKLRISVLSCICYSGMIMLFMVDVLRRFIRKDIKRLLLLSSCFLLLWLLIRTIKYEALPTHALMTRYAWYSYYLCHLGTVCTLALAIHRLHHHKYGLPFIVSTLVMIVFVMTNDFHQLIFRFPKGIHTFNDYTYQLGYYIVMGFILVVLLYSFLAIVKMQKIHQEKIIYPIVFLLFGMFYCLSYISGINPNYFKILFRPADIACVIYIGLMESLLTTHLFPANDHYHTLIRQSSLHIGLFNEQGEKVIDPRDGISLSMVKEALDHTLPLKQGCFLHTQALESGYAYYIEDVSELIKMRKKLYTLKETLENQQAMLEKENNIAIKSKALAKKTQIYDAISKETIKQREKIALLLETEPFDQAILQAAILGAYIKRYAHLRLTASQYESLSTMTLHLAFLESIAAMEAYGMQVHLTMPKETFVTSKQVLTCYAVFEEIVEAALPLKATMMIIITYDKHLIMQIEVAHSAHSAHVPCHEEEGILYYKWEGCL